MHIILLADADEIDLNFLIVHRGKRCSKIYFVDFPPSSLPPRFDINHRRFAYLSRRSRKNRFRVYIFWTMACIFLEESFFSRGIPAGSHVSYGNTIIPAGGHISYPVTARRKTGRIAVWILMRVAGGEDAVWNGERKGGELRADDRTRKRVERQVVYTRPAHEHFSSVIGCATTRCCLFVIGGQPTDFQTRVFHILCGREINSFSWKKEKKYLLYVYWYNTVFKLIHIYDFQTRYGNNK